MAQNTKSKYITVRVDEDLLTRLAELADRNERSTSSEARLAIRQHIDEASRIPPRATVVAHGDTQPAA